MIQNNEHDTENQIHIVLSVYNLGDEYIRHAATTILSILSNTKSPVTFHLLQIDKESAKNNSSSKINKEKLDVLSIKYNTKIEIHNVEIPNWFYELKAMKTYHVGILLRLFIPTCLKDISKAIYLDCDIIVNLDIKELWDIEITNYPLGACIDTNFPQNLGLKKLSPLIRKTYKKMELTNSYFNSGVLLLNLDYLRKKHNLVKESSEYLLNFPHALFSDQDALNYLFSSTYLQLDKKFNTFQDELTSENIKNCCIHYVAQSKPWIIYTNEYDNYYWKYLLQTPWANSYHCVTKYLRNAPDYGQLQGFKSLSFRKQMHYISTYIKISIQSLFSRIKTLLRTMIV